MMNGPGAESVAPGFVVVRAAPRFGTGAEPARLNQAGSGGMDSRFGAQNILARIMQLFVDWQNRKDSNRDTDYIMPDHRQPKSEKRSTTRRKTADVALEREIQRWIVDLVQTDTFAAYVDGGDEVEYIVETGRDPRKSPAFTIDRFTREKYAEGAAIALKSLAFLDFISGDRDISRTLGEELRPDVVAYNPEEETIVVFELKKSTQTGRQALTELLAYEHELQNHLPLLGPLNIIYVLISPEWSTLMDHALIGAVTWARKTCIGLEVHDTPEGRRLKVRIPDSWAPLLSFGLPAEALSTATLALYSYTTAAATQEWSFDDRQPRDGKDDDPDSDVKRFRELKTALELIARDGERVGSHGFALLCDNNDFPPCPWLILVGVINPLAFLRHSLAVGAPAGETDVTKFFSDPHRGYLDTGMDSNIGRVVKRASRYLRETYQPTLESYLDWSTARTVMRGIAAPILMEFWGVLGDFAREFILHDGVRRTYLTLLDRTKHDWRTPLVGLTVLSELTKERLFLHGLAQCSDCFRFGILIGGARLVYNNMVLTGSEPMDERWRTLVEWLEIELAIAATEVAAMYRSAADIEEPPPTLLVGDHDPPDKERALVKYSTWFLEHFVGKLHILHASLFASAMDSAALFDSELRKWLTPEQVSELESGMEDLLSMAVSACVFSYHDLGDPDVLSPTSHARFREVRKKVGLTRVDVRRMRKSTLMGKLARMEPRKLSDSFESLLLPLMDELIGPIFHRLNPLEPLSIDWEYLKQGIQRARTGPDQVAAVIIAPDGTLGTGIVDVPVALQLDDPENEVWFMSILTGAAVLRKTTWADLAAGDYRSSPSKGTEASPPSEQT